MESWASQAVSQQPSFSYFPSRGVYNTHERFLCRMLLVDSIDSIRRDFLYTWKLWVFPFWNQVGGQAPVMSLRGVPNPALSSSLSTPRFIPLSPFQVEHVMMFLSLCLNPARIPDQRSFGLDQSDRINRHPQYCLFGQPDQISHALLEMPGFLRIYNAATNHARTI